MTCIEAPPLPVKTLPSAWLSLLVQPSPDGAKSTDSEPRHVDHGRHGQLLLNVKQSDEPK